MRHTVWVAALALLCAANAQASEGIARQIAVIQATHSGCSPVSGEGIFRTYKLNYLTYGAGIGNGSIRVNTILGQ